MSSLEAGASWLPRMAKMGPPRSSRSLRSRAASHGDALSSPPDRPRPDRPRGSGVRHLPVRAPPLQPPGGPGRRLGGGRRTAARGEPATSRSQRSREERDRGGRRRTRSASRGAPCGGARGQYGQLHGHLLTKVPTPSHEIRREYGRAVRTILAPRRRRSKEGRGQPVGAFDRRRAAAMSIARSGQVAGPPARGHSQRRGRSRPPPRLRPAVYTWSTGEGRRSPSICSLSASSVTFPARLLRVSGLCGL